MSRRIEVRVGRLVVDDPALARADLAAAIESGLAGGAAEPRGRPPRSKGDPSALGVAAAVAREIRRELPR